VCRVSFIIAPACCRIFYLFRYGGKTWVANVHLCLLYTLFFFFEE